MSINLPSLPSMPSIDISTLPSPSEISEVVSDVLVTAVDTAGEAATVVVETARRRPRTVGLVVGAALVALLVAIVVKRRRSPAPLITTSERPADFVAA